MNIADRELCQVLYELSGWGYNFHAYGEGKHDLTDRMWRNYEAKTTGSNWWTAADDYEIGNPLRDPYDGRRPTGITHNVLERAPAYTLGYLLRKLQERPAVRLRQMAGRQWWVYCEWGEVQSDKSIKKMHLDATSNTPENAATMLCIELIKQGALPIR